jgi:hypothetical protein
LENAMGVKSGSSRNRDTEARSNSLFLQGRDKII